MPSGFQKSAGRPYLCGVSYRVFARKYRPQTFDEVVGQEHITRTLQNAISVRTGGAGVPLSSVRAGSARSATRRILAKGAGLRGRPAGSLRAANATPAGEIAEGRSLDVLEIDGASNNGVREHSGIAGEHRLCRRRAGPTRSTLSTRCTCCQRRRFQRPAQDPGGAARACEVHLCDHRGAESPGNDREPRASGLTCGGFPAEAIARHLLADRGEGKHCPRGRAPLRRSARGRGGRPARRGEHAGSMRRLLRREHQRAGCHERFRVCVARSHRGAPRDGSFKRDAVRRGLKIVAEQRRKREEILSRLLGDLDRAGSRPLWSRVAETRRLAPRDKLLMLLDHFARDRIPDAMGQPTKLQLDVGGDQGRPPARPGQPRRGHRNPRRRCEGAAPPRHRRSSTDPRATISKPDPGRSPVHGGPQGGS